MPISDIEKEEFIKFEEAKSKDDYNQAIESANIPKLKYRNGRVAP